ncbi:MAG: peptide chain release factor 1 [Candidatus Marinimicrobia bacterium]|nr:peptide chain release factor 1 [Candidatus Neomarinimicrobiota bacterium]|tara:strand:+ start:10595 stop:11656 length:1062 start_codon:yes stop_codon:yes gene_type:complete
MIDKLKEIVQRYNQITEELSNPNIVSDIEHFKNLSKEHSDLTEINLKSLEYIQKHKQLVEDEEILKGNDTELKELVQDEIEGLKADLTGMEEVLKIMLIPRNPDDDKNTILEIRSGTGGEEAALFASNLYRMYLRYAERQGWMTEILNLSDSETGGIKEAVVGIKGKGAYGELKFESGVHRVQRVPATESSGRLHTSAATVAVLPEAVDVDIIINDTDIKIDTYRASGAGGQHVNKTESAIRITHIPTGLVVTCQDESSQHKNKDKALKVLRTRLYEVKKQEEDSKRASVRKSMVSTGDRSAKIRTYNFPQGRVTDHRINLTLYKLDEILDGDLVETIEALKIEERKSQLSEI